MESIPPTAGREQGRCSHPSPSPNVCPPRSEGGGRGGAVLQAGVAPAGSRQGQEGGLVAWRQGATVKGVRMGRETRSSLSRTGL